MENRLTLIKSWLTECLGHTVNHLKPLTGDASFRRYFRLKSNGTSYILMDAPPEKEDCKCFFEITTQMGKANINVPHIHHAEFEQGFLLIDDFGDTLLLDVLDAQSANNLYQQAIMILLQIQSIDTKRLPLFDEALLMEEMHLFTDWYCEKHLEMNISLKQKNIFTTAFSLLVENHLTQPQVFVHRDYHSRNLMLSKENTIGVIDYQDAVCGAITYDLVSLLKDCYVKWPQQKIDTWMNYFLIHYQNTDGSKDCSEQQFKRWFDLTGVQRQLKASGIFARLFHRDNKDGYLKDIPRTLSYIHDCLPQYPEFSEFLDLLKQISPHK